MVRQRGNLYVNDLGTEDIARILRTRQGGGIRIRRNGLPGSRNQNGNGTHTNQNVFQGGPFHTANGQGPQGGQSNLYQGGTIHPVNGQGQGPRGKKSNLYQGGPIIFAGARHKKKVRFVNRNGDGLQYYYPGREAGGQGARNARPNTGELDVEIGDAGSEYSSRDPFERPFATPYERPAGRRRPNRRGDGIDIRTGNVGSEYSGRDPFERQAGRWSPAFSNDSPFQRSAHLRNLQGMGAMNAGPWASAGGQPFSPYNVACPFLQHSSAAKSISCTCNAGRPPQCEARRIGLLQMQAEASMTAVRLIRYGPLRGQNPDGVLGATLYMNLMEMPIMDDRLEEEHVDSAMCECTERYPPRCIARHVAELRRNRRWAACHLRFYMRVRANDGDHGGRQWDLMRELWMVKLAFLEEITRMDMMYGVRTEYQGLINEDMGLWYDTEAIGMPEGCPELA